MDKIIHQYLNSHDVDAIGVGIIDFKKKDFKAKDYQKNIEDKSEIFFDLASLTKVLTNSTFYLKHLDKMDEELRMLLEHRAGIVPWGLLSKSSWEKDILSFEIKKSQTLYSDYSALRFMLDASRKSGLDFRTEIEQFFAKDTKHWLDLDTLDRTLQNGFEKGQPNFTKVHDPNARNIKSFLAHAGIFSTTQSLCQTLLNIDKELNLLNQIPKYKSDNRFSLGWDTVEDISTTTAGVGCSELTFGHLGFTGTSIWIDPLISRGAVILSNSTKNYWYDKKNLNNLRRDIGAYIWSL